MRIPPGKGLCLVLLIWCLALAVSGCGGARPSSSAQSPAPSVQPPAPSPMPAPAKAATWNTTDPNVETNGNLSFAVNLLQNRVASAMEKEAESVQPAALMKAPWKYYGKVVKVTGAVGIVQEYPPGGDVSRAFGGGEASEVVLMTEDGSIVDAMLMAGTGDVNVGDVATVYGYPIGLVDVQNKLGGMTTQVVIVGRSVRK